MGLRCADYIKEYVKGKAVRLINMAEKSSQEHRIHVSCAILAARVGGKVMQITQEKKRR
jgi:hypothetical protein